LAQEDLDKECSFFILVNKSESAMSALDLQDIKHLWWQDFLGAFGVKAR
jgi:hypothetical protein